MDASTLAVTRRFRDRTEAGRVLAKRLAAYANREDVVVLGLPRGGIVVAFEVARALQAPLDVCVVRKLPAPEQEELAMGAIGSHGSCIVNHDLVRALQVSEDALRVIIAAQQDELERRERLYRDHRPAPVIRDRTVILVDDGLATGSTMRAAVLTLRAQRPARLVVAVPIASPSVCEEFRAEADEVICAVTPQPFYSVGFWYEDFSQTTDAQVRQLLHQAEQELRAAGPHA